jgi:putative hemolysin
MTPEVIAGAGLIVAAILAMGFAAGAETALERSSRARLAALAGEGQRGARRLAGNGADPERFLGALTTVRALAAGILVSAAALVGADKWGPAGAFLSGTGAAAVSALVQMTAGNVASRHPELAAVKLSVPIRAIHAVAGPLAMLLSLPGRLVARSIRAVTRDGQSELLALVEREEASGGVREAETRMIRRVFALEEKTAREIMVPRIDMAVADIDESVLDVARLVTERGYSRIPVFREKIDDIAGVVFAKDLLRVVTNGARQRTLAELMRPVYFIPESKRLDELLTEMQTRRVHIAIVVDEYGGTAGLVTMEDLIEEIVGEIEDEYDIAGPRTEVISEDAAIVDGAVATETLHDLFGLDVDSENFDTIGGFVMHHLGRLPAPGDSFVTDNLRFEVLSVRGRRVGQVRVERESAEEQEELALVSSRSA